MRGLRNIRCEHQNISVTVPDRKKARVPFVKGLVKFFSYFFFVSYHLMVEKIRLIHHLGVVHILYNKKISILTPLLPHITLYKQYYRPSPEII